MHMIAEAGRGVVVLIREHSARPRWPSGCGCCRRSRGRTGELRDYGIGAQILLDLGVKNMILLSNTRRTIIGLEGYGLNIVARQPVDGA